VRRLSSELKCCELCEAYATCDHKGECCPECSYYDPEEHVCMATHKPKPSEAKKTRATTYTNDELDVDEATFLFEDDEDEEDFEPEDDEDFEYEDDWD
jgi:hypothetical protein